jgi:hypothetical protein
LAGAKVVLVLGDTSCGAVKSATDDAELSNLTGLRGPRRRFRVGARDMTSPQQRKIPVVRGFHFSPAALQLRQLYPG